MNDSQDRKPRPWWLSINALGLCLLLGAFAFSMYHVMQVQRQLFNPNETILRIAHWQLELGYRDALAEVIKDYEKLQAARGKRVRVMQMAVTERVYGPWLNTNLISGQAPDLCLVGMSNMLDNDAYLSRYFVPMSQLVSQPNPYNRGTELATVPWRDTFFDGMRGVYNARLQDYFSVPTATYNLRLFYNKQMFREATGSDAPPQTFGQLMQACDKITDLSKRKGKLLIPIAGGQYSVSMFQDRYQVAFLAGLEKDLDRNLDGWVSDQEVYTGLTEGKISMEMPRVKAYHECLRRLCRQFGQGFGGKDRQTAAFEFVQQRAGMIATGSWDARSLFAQAQEAGFDVGIFDFPMPARDEEFGQWVVGKPTEAGVGTAGGYGLYRFSRNFDQALDFLQYLTSKKVNQKQMELAEWIPIVIGTEPAGRMAAFAPDPEGFSAHCKLTYGGAVDTAYNGQLWSYLQGEGTYESLAKSLMDATKNPQYGGDRTWTLEWDGAIKQIRNQERTFASQVVRELMLDAPDATEKERRMVLQQVSANNAQDHRYRFKQVRGFDLPEK